MAERIPVPDAPPPPRGWPGPHGAARPPASGRPPGAPAAGRGADAPVGTGLAAAAIAIYFVGQLVVGLLAGGLLAGSGVTDAAGVDPVVLLAAAVAGQVAGLGAALLLLRSRGARLAAVIGPVRPVLRRLGAGLALGAGTMVGSALVVALLVRAAGSDATPEQLILDEALAGGARTVLALVAAALLAPVAEELLFRGLLYRALRRRRSVAVAAAISAVAFSVVHLDVAATQPLALVGLALVGVVLALAYERSGSLLVPVAAHAGYNGTALAVAIVAQRTGVMDLVGALP
jgi:membrane protease YdiL (CAAX protease family)